MIPRKPLVGDRIEFNKKDSPYDQGSWVQTGTVVAVYDNICYLHNSALPEEAHKRFFGKSPVPAGCLEANYAFIWAYKDGTNKFHRIANV